MQTQDYPLQATPSLRRPLALTIGTFDGIHQGHQALLDRCREAAGEGGSVVLFTFSNHPRKLLFPDSPPPLVLCNSEQKIALLEEAGVDLLLLASFTPGFSQQTAEEFLRGLRNHLPFDHLILGHDAYLGHRREGTPQHLQELASTLSFDLDYLPPLLADERVISSRWIRELLEEGKLEEVTALLGRPHSVRGRVIQGPKRGHALGFPTANLSIEGLALPPFGVYSVWTHIEGASLPGVANLGRAPTVDRERPLLEVHLLQEGEWKLYGKEIEVEWVSYLRPEKAFPSFAALRQQIAMDCEKARQILEKNYYLI